MRNKRLLITRSGLPQPIMFVFEFTQSRFSNLFKNKRYLDFFKNEKEANPIGYS